MTSIRNPSRVRALASATRLAIAGGAVIGGLMLIGRVDRGGTEAVASAVAAPAQPSGIIVFRRFFDAAHDWGALFAIRPDGHGERQITHPGMHVVDSLNGAPSFTPDGRALIFDQTDATGTGSLWRVNLDGTGAHRLRTLSGFPGDGWPSLSPDGREIAVARAFGSQDGFNDLKTSLYVLQADGSHPREVAPFGYDADVQGAAWSPDGRHITFSVVNNGPGRPAGGSALYSVAPTGRGLHRITPWSTNAKFAGPQYSPDGRLVLFRLSRPGQDFGGDLYTVHADGGGLRRLSRFPAGSSLGGAAWSPDGRYIVFANTGIGGQDDIFLMRSDGTHVTPVTRTPAWDSAPTWTRNR